MFLIEFENVPELLGMKYSVVQNERRVYSVIVRRRRQVGIF